MDHCHRQNFVQTQKTELGNQPTPNNPKLLEVSSLASASPTSNHLSLVPHRGQLPAPDLGPLTSLLPAASLFPGGLLPALFLPQGGDPEIRSVPPWPGHQSCHPSELSTSKMKFQP